MDKLFLLYLNNYSELDFRPKYISAILKWIQGSTTYELRFISPIIFTTNTILIQAISSEYNDGSLYKIKIRKEGNYRVFHD